MRVTILGAGTAMSVPRYSPAGLYVRVAHEHLILDAGAGTLQRMHRLGVTYLDIDRIFLTHFHPDHCLDVVSFLFAMRVPQPGRTKPLTIYGPRGLKPWYRRLEKAFHGWITPKTYTLHLKELGEKTLWFDGYRIRTRFMRHSARAIGYRIEEHNTSVVYSGDTEYCEGIVELGRSATLLILECSMTDERKVGGHLTPSDCGRIAAEADCRRLALTHFYPVFKRYPIRARVKRSYRGPLSLAKDMTSYRV